MIISLNARGLRDSIKKESTVLFCKNEKAQCVLLQKTHSNDMDEKSWLNQWGTNRSAGVAIFLNNLNNLKR